MPSQDIPKAPVEDTVTTKDVPAAFTESVPPLKSATAPKEQSVPSLNAPEDGKDDLSSQKEPTALESPKNETIASVDKPAVLENKSIASEESLAVLTTEPEKLPKSPTAMVDESEAKSPATETSTLAENPATDKDEPVTSSKSPTKDEAVMNSPKNDSSTLLESPADVTKPESPKAKENEPTAAEEKSVPLKKERMSRKRKAEKPDEGLRRVTRSSSQKKSSTR